MEEGVGEKTSFRKTASRNANGEKGIRKRGGQRGERGKKPTTDTPAKKKPRTWAPLIGGKRE